ncbi:hypothetical protein DL766_000701 [Monosporascus sp. MC13-8B]|nr:hypothetical protein DL763_007408 [Monosporascus cannonballus]RYP38892.1 hypothetical protein DL766_000701 [Monosporascus sp. MC13-8B]
MPIYTTGQGGQRDTTVEPVVTRVLSPSATTSPVRSRHHVGRGIVDLLEPAMEGPPSPERIRALSKRLKQSSLAEKHNSQFTVSSGSSFISATSGTPSWDDDRQPSRRSSQRSISGSNPSRDRPDSVTVFGKSLFSRKGKLRREPSDPNFLSSTTHLSETTPDPVPTREHRSVSAMFARRKSTKGGDAEAHSQKKIQISEPYNFQHLTHTHKESLPDLGLASRDDLVSEFSCIRAGQKPTVGSLKGIQANDIEFRNPFSSEALSVPGGASRGSRSGSSVEAELDPGQPQYEEVSPRRHRNAYAGRSESRDQVRSPPLRPPRSPHESGFASPPIPPPPRTSSRVSLRSDALGQLPSTGRHCSATDSSFQQPDPPLDVTLAQSVHDSLPKYSHAITTPDEAAWPLASSAMASLPELPEEEESHLFTEEPLLSPTHQRSPLRGSISVPALHRISMSHTTSRRPPSNSSDTLGRFDIITVRASRPSVPNDKTDDDIDIGTWEDDIDYCYDHAVEADCDYAWERPSGEMLGEIAERETQAANYRISATNSPGTFSPNVSSPLASKFSIPSPAIHKSDTAQATTAAPPKPVQVTSNFSLPQRGHKRVLSRSSSFNKEPQGSAWSPSFLVPTDYKQQMLEYEKVGLQDDGDEDDDENFLTHLQRNESSLRLDKPSALLNARYSASTTISAFSERSLASSRHISNTSVSTAFTRWTASSMGASFEGFKASCEASPSASVAAGDEHTVVMGENESGTTPFPELTGSALEQGYTRERHMSEANVLFNASLPGDPDVQEPPRLRRRARTTSKSHKPPQLGLFPHVSSNVRHF